MIAQHPYASAPTQSNFRGTTYERSSPVQPSALAAASNGAHTPTAPTSSEPYLYNGGQTAKPNGFAAHDSSPANGYKDGTAARGMNIYEQQAQMTMNGVGDQDQHGDGRKRGFWAAFCCRA